MTRNDDKRISGDVVALRHLISRQRDKTCFIHYILSCFSLFRSVLVGVHAGVCLGQRTYTFHKLYVFHYFPIVVFLLFEIQSAGLYPGLPNLTWVSLPADNNILLPGENFRLNRRQIFWGKRKYSSLERKVHPFHILSSPVIYFCNNWSCAILLALHPNNPFKIVLAASFDLEEFQFHF